MKAIKCSLMLPKECACTVEIRELPAKTVTVHQDKGYRPKRSILGGGSFAVDFKGCKVIQLVISDPEGEMMPVTLTVAGKCRFSRKCRDEFSITMRSRKESLKKGWGNNGEFNWPDVRGFYLCPVCGTTHEPSGKKEYWMLIHPLMQAYTAPNNSPLFGFRMICRLTCSNCFDSLTNGQIVQVKKADGSCDRIPVAEVLHRVAFLPFLDYGEGMHVPKVERAFDAWPLYHVWEKTGTWAAIQVFHANSFSSGFTNAGLPVDVRGRGSENLMLGGEDEKQDEAVAAVTISNQVTRKDDWKCKACGKEAKHLCSRCKVVKYCSAKCQQLDWPRHKADECFKASKNLPKVELKMQTCSISPPGLPEPESAIKCSKCKEEILAEGLPMICLACGEFIMCECCTWLPKFRQEGVPICVSCGQNSADLSPCPGILLQLLLKKRPTGQHVHFAEMCLAQCLLNNRKGTTGILPDIEKAKSEYLRLANDENFGPAQYFVADMYRGEVNNMLPEYGPLNCLDNKYTTNPFPTAPDTARHYYNRALAKKLHRATLSVGVLCMNAAIYPLDKARAASLFRQISQKNPQAMCNLAQMLLAGDEGVPENRTESLNLFRTAANKYDMKIAQLMLAQLSQTGLVPVAEGLRMMQKIEQSGGLLNHG
mmetsp:Transcript_22511/g.51541  ORF Transcript_22511/g.51541 Transcript_22511/m.51541 type:complete len:651 (-) Transcript_22511:546-2498(-)